MSRPPRPPVGRPTVGVVGAGQLARMLHRAAIDLDVHLRILAADPDDSAAQVAPDVVVGSPEDLAALRRLADGCDAITFDHELVPAEHLAALAADGHVLRPAPRANAFAQDKLHQRQRFAELGVPVPAHAPVPAPQDLVAFGQAQGWPVVAKAVRGGYDGRGVWVLDGAEAARELARRAAAEGTQLFAEAHVPLDLEVAVLVARRPGGESVTWPVTQTVQVDGMLRESVAPAPIPRALAAEAEELARRIADHIDAVGVLAVELFVADGRLLVNELALRVHNSGHWTSEGARTSQFANHLRAVLDWPLGATAMAAPVAVTANVVGAGDRDPRDRLRDALAVDGVAVHLYGKAPRAGRKLGHVTAVGDDPDEVLARARRAAALLTGTTAPATAAAPAGGAA